MEIRGSYQRARTDGEKELRRKAILEAARKVFHEVGNDRFAISAVASEAGVSKATIFVYFPNKDDLLLSLFTASVEDFAERFKARLKDRMSDRSFCQAFLTSAEETPILWVLRGQLAMSIERNVSRDSLIEVKRAIARIGTGLGTAIESAIGLPQSSSRNLVRTLFNLMAGSMQIDVASHIAYEDLPDDVVSIIEGGRLRPSFMRDALAQLKGIRNRDATS